ncbi:Guanylate kinase [Exophiala dermatitidis]|uniref:Guanylate kinase n=2 Tax=Exophiala dermatitidis TaxID=5970 RepID=H6BV42_EXODN|nr:guanylate kinase [Exophiala dermatitidis NIH/UT8656]EHY55825.1 guanylate kinase [Exophiala dermatitidis NIH/UT8656]KAJ4511519.1 guanylate kinase [Exophiala dermatitidis]KAJ4549657.1 guanylate kinase [Exophiala dermatitidis]
MSRTALLLASPAPLFNNSMFKLLLQRERPLQDVLYMFRRGILRAVRPVDPHSSLASKYPREYRKFARGFTMAPTPIPADAPRPIVLSGPSGTGKSTLIKRLFAKHPDLFGFSVSHTTRNPRPGEQDGVHYHFTTTENFEKMIAENAFVEHAKFGGNYYGSSKMAVQDVAEGRGKTIEGTPAEGKRICIFDIEMEGVKQLRRSPLNPRICFIQPPSLEVLEQRLRGRGDTSEDAIQKRLAQAKKEMEYCQTEGKGEKVIINDDLDTAFKELDEWVMQGI